MDIACGAAAAVVPAPLTVEFVALLGTSDCAEGELIVIPGPSILNFCYRDSLPGGLLFCCVSSLILKQTVIRGAQVEGPGQWIPPGMLWMIYFADASDEENDKLSRLCGLGILYAGMRSVAG